MGDGSRNYAWYYSVCSAIYLAISIASFVQISSQSSDCQQKCPLLITSTESLNYAQCACYPLVNSTNGVTAPWGAYGFSSQEEMDTFNNDPSSRQAISIDRFSAVQGQSCYICNSLEPTSTTVYEACDQFGTCTTPGVEGFRSVSLSGLSSECKLLQEPAAVLRGTVVSVLYAFAVFYLLMGLSAGLVSSGYFVFADKWDDDFGRLSRCEVAMGYIAKNAPVVVRLCNFLVLFFLIYSLVLVLSYEVCKTDTNADGEIGAFFNAMKNLTVTIAFLWAIGYIVGTVFNCVVPKDTPFYAPQTPTDSRDGKCYRCCVGSIHCIVRNGP